jgi:CzcA family heavy metal efflux pump
MVHRIIEWSLHNRFIVLVIASALLVWGIISVKKNPIDAIPDLSENQVIVFTEWMGRAPQLIEDQVTYPLVTNLQGLPRIKYVRGTSMFGMSFIYIIFEDDVDIYWARSRVLERLSTVNQTLPQGVTPQLGPDGTGVGHILWYTLDAPTLDLGEQRAIQDWYVKFALQNVPGVSEIASFGGFQKEYSITLDPNKLLYYKIPVSSVISAVRTNNNESGGRKFEQSDIGYIIKTSGYLKSIQEIGDIPIKNENGLAVRVADIGQVQMTGQTRLGIFDQDGQGERVGGIVVMRYGQNAAAVIDAVKKKMKEVSKGLPKGVKFDIVYDRGKLITESIDSIKHTLIEEMIMVTLIVILFLFHWRSALSIVIQIPITLAISFILLNAFGISSNIMSLTGIALAIGVIVDNGIIMSENSYKHLSERYALWKKQTHLNDLKS